MATLIVTKDKGGAGRPEDMTVIPPSQQVPIEALQAVGKGTGLGGLVIADAVSAMAMHERAAATAARAAASQAETVERRKLHEELAQLHTGRVEALETLLGNLKLPRLYASPAGRMAHFLAEHAGHAPLLAGSIDRETMEFTLLDVAFTLGERSLANTRALAALAEAAKPSTTKKALEATAKTLDADTSMLEKLRTARTVALLVAAMAANP